jgi:surface antigen
LLLFWPASLHAASLRELTDQLKKAEDSLTRYKELKEKEQDKSEQFSEEIEKTEAEISQVKSVILTLSSQIKTKESDIATTAGSIEEKTININKLSADQDNALATYFELNNMRSDVEMVAQKDVTLSSYMTEAEFLHALQDRIIQNIEQTAKVKSDLEATKSAHENQKKELDQLKGEQEAKNRELNSERKQNISLFNKSKATEAEYQNLIKKLQSEESRITNAIYEERRRLSAKNNEIYAGGTSGYPYAAIHDVDPWKFLTRECTSYAAWKWNVVYGRQFINTRPGQGSAYNWPNLARDQGYRVVSSPQATAIISWSRPMFPGDQWGHVAIVEAINADGTIDVSEYNYQKYAFTYRKNVRYWDYGKASFIVP